MTAYVDTSCLLAVAFREAAGERTLELIHSAGDLLGSNLTEAELRAVGQRASMPEVTEFLEDVNVVLPTRRLTPEIDRVLEVGYLRGADLIHVATALYAAESPGDVAFLTLDERQREVAAALGFQTPA